MNTSLMKQIVKSCQEDKIQKLLLDRYSLAEAEEWVSVYQTGEIFNFTLEELLRVESPAFPNSDFLRTTYNAAKSMAIDMNLSVKTAFAQCMASVQKSVQTKRWLRNKQIYTFDTDMARELSKTASDIELPYNFFTKLPYQYLYLDFSECSEEFKESICMDGCIVNVNDSKMLFEDGAVAELNVIKMITFKNGEPKDTRSTTVFNNKENGISIKEFDVNGSIVLTEGIENADVDRNGMAKQLYLIIQALLYLCSFEPDIRENPASKAAFRKAKQSKKRNEELPAREYKVGERFGTTFRKWTSGSLGQGSSNSTDTGRHVKPHMRKAHWHRYWTGKKNSSEREIIIKWVSECYCGVSEKDAENTIDTVAHKIEKKKKK